MNNFRTVDRETDFLLPPSVAEWLPERHLARFVVEVVESLDLRVMMGSYRGSGSASYLPAMLLGLLIYGYATGVFSSRKLERATYDSVAFRFIAANQHPDHDTIATFRKRFLKEIEALFVRVLMLAREMGVLEMGTVALDGTKIHANASRHTALSYEYATKLEARLKEEVAQLLAKAEAADAADLPDGLSIPDELALREDRLKKLAEARAKIEARAKERYEREKGEYDAKMAAREAKIAETGKKPGGKASTSSAAAAADRRPFGQGSDQSDRRGVAYHARGRRRLRSMLQRAGGGGDGQQPGRGGGRDAGAERQAAGRAHARQTRGARRERRDLREAVGGHGLLQRRQRRGLREGRDRAVHRDGAAAASSPVVRTLAGETGDVGGPGAADADAGGADRGRPDADGAGAGFADARDSDARRLGAGKADGGRGQRPSAKDAGRTQALRASQTDAGARVRDHQIGNGFPPVFTARP